MAYRVSTNDDGIVADAHREPGDGARSDVAPSEDGAVEALDEDVGEVNHWEDAQTHRVAVEAAEGDAVRIADT